METNFSGYCLYWELAWVWVSGLKFSPHGYGSLGNRRSDSKNDLAHPMSQISGYAIEDAIRAKLKM